MLDQHFDTFRQVYDERYQAKYRFWRPVINLSVAAFLKCGDLQQGFARIRCPDCHHEMFVAFSCKQRCTCPSCHQKRALVTAIHVAQEVCAPVEHRQVVLTIPKRLRVHTRFDRKLLGKLSSCAWNCLKAEAGRLLGREDVVPGMIGADLHRHRPVPGELLIIPTRIGTGTMRTSCGVEAYSTSIHVHVALRQASIWLPASRNGRRCVC